jgi:hypothetical protein
MNLALGCFVSFALLSLPSDGNRAQPGLASPSYRFADFDRDGLLDLYVVRASGDRLFKNLGDGTFGDVTYAMGLSRETRSRIALWQDFDCDGWADLFLALGAGGARLLRNSGGTSFVDATSELGLAPDVGVVLIAEFFDLDADGRVDLHVVSERGDALLHNRGGRFAPAALPGVDPFEESVVVLPAPSV